ncbi:MAG: RidA family protein [Deltaproteobacteria bacterium]|jgi:2-iminobutanoate/2-iminopropanoate deaminase|nr:RidA family protein [Deltaproteobacteria bacterium]
MPTPVATSHAPQAIGPYSQAVSSGGLLFVSGQLPVDPQTGTMPADIAAQVKNSLSNVSAILRKAGSDLSKVLKVGVFLTDLGDFAAANAIYETFFKEPFPARTTVQVAALPKGAKVEIDAIAEL